MTTFLAGMVPTADELNGLVTQIYRCTSTLSKTSDVTLEEIPGLTFTVEAGFAYSVKALITYTGPTAADIKFDWVRTGGVLSADILRYVIGPAAGTTTNADTAVAMPRREGDTDQVIGADGGAGSGATSYIEHITIIPSGDGTVAMRAAQNVSTGSATTVTTASRLIVVRAALV